MSIIDIVYIIALVVGPLLALIVTLTQRWQWSLIPLISFLIFWVAWLLMNTIVPFDLMDKIWWFVLSIGVLIGVEIIAILIRWYTVKKCDPEVRICDPF